MFKESFPLARERIKHSPQFLDASCIQLDNAHLAEADLQQLWIPEGSLRNAALRRADFSEASLYKVNLCQAELKEAILTKTNLYKANLESADLSNAHLPQADLRGANLSGANLSGADLRGANLKEANLEDALSLKDTNLCGATGLTEEQYQPAKAKELSLMNLGKERHDHENRQKRRIIPLPTHSLTTIPSPPQPLHLLIREIAPLPDGEIPQR